MSETADRVKKIVVEHLGVEPDKVTEDASFIDDLGLLLQPILLEAPPGADHVIVAAEGMALEKQVRTPPFLRLPNVGHLMDEQVDVGLALREVFGPEIAAGVEVQVPRRGHHIIDRLQRPPFALDQLDLRVIDGRTEYRAAKRDFAGGERTSIHAGLLA